MWDRLHVYKYGAYGLMNEGDLCCLIFHTRNCVGSGASKHGKHRECGP